MASVISQSAIPDFGDITLTVDAAEVSVDDVEEELDRLRSRFGTLVTVDRPAKTGDFAQIDLTAVIGGEEVDTAANISYEECKRVLKISRQPISLDRPVGESEDSYFGDFIEDNSVESPVNAATNEMLKDKIEGVLKTLTYREREIIKLRYGLGDGYTYTLEEVGRIFKVTRERVRQIEAKAVRKLQHPVRSRQLEGFLDGSMRR